MEQPLMGFPPPAETPDPRQALETLIAAGHIPAAEWARLHGKSPRQARHLCDAGRVPGAIPPLFGKWLVPDATPWPEGLPEGAAAHRKRRPG